MYRQCLLTKLHSTFFPDQKRNVQTAALAIVQYRMMFFIHESQISPGVCSSHCLQLELNYLTPEQFNSEMLRPNFWFTKLLNCEQLSHDAMLTKIVARFSLAGGIMVASS